MKTFGLIGYPLSHSFSKQYFTDKFEKAGKTGHQYQLFPLEHVEGLCELIKAHPSLCGLNVTIPHKIAVIPYLNALDVAAEKIGAVNCIAIKRSRNDLFLKGYNTDAAGFEQSLIPLLQPWHKKALVFGNGGASKAVQYVLAKLDIEFMVFSRKGETVPDDNVRKTESPENQIFNYSVINKGILNAHHLLINTTPLGMYPETGTAPTLPYHLITAKHLAYDLVYNPGETLFLKNAKASGATTKNGLEMLALQAEESWYIWNDNEK